MQTIQIGYTRWNIKNRILKSIHKPNHLYDCCKLFIYLVLAFCTFFVLHYTVYTQRKEGEKMYGDFTLFINLLYFWQFPDNVFSTLVQCFSTSSYDDEFFFLCIFYDILKSMLSKTICVCYVMINWWNVFLLVKCN